MPNRKRALVVVTRKLPDIVETRMRELFDARLNLDDKPMSHADLAEAARVADVLVPTITDHIDAAVLELRRAGEISLEQAAPFAPIRVARVAREEEVEAWSARSA